MEIKLTKDAEKLVASIYKSYLEKRDNGISKINAKRFSEDEIYKLSSETPEDTDETLREIKSVFPLKVYINGDITLSDQIISYMEQKFKNGLKDVLSFLSQFIP